MKKPAKSETLTLRIDPRLRFAIDVLARTTKSTITGLMEKSILAQATALRIGGVDWAKMWHPEEAVRELRLAAAADVYPSYEEERRLHFCQLWWVFFYHDREAGDVHEARTVILWPHVDDLIEYFEASRGSDYFAVATRMTGILKAAKVKGPTEAEIMECGQ